MNAKEGEKEERMIPRGCYSISKVQQFVITFIAAGKAAVYRIWK